MRINGAGGRGRTDTSCYGPRILSPVRLPFRHTGILSYHLYSSSYKCDFIFCSVVPFPIVNKFFWEPLIYLKVGGTTQIRTGDEGFADPSLTTWRWCHLTLLLYMKKIKKATHFKKKIKKFSKL